MDNMIPYDFLRLPCCYFPTSLLILYLFSSPSPIKAPPVFPSLPSNYL